MAPSESTLKNLLVEAWRKVSQDLLLTLGESAYREWIAPLILKDIHKGEVLLEAASQRLADRVADKFGIHLASEFSNSLGVPLRVRVTCRQITPLTDPRCAPELLTPIEHVGNRMALRALKGAGDSSHDPRFNPLYLWGREGVGKTYMIRNLLLNKDEAGGIYTTASTLLEDLAHSRRRPGGISRFRERMLGTRLVVLDEVHLLRGKPAAQMEVVHLAKILLSRQARVIFAGRYAPREIRRMDRSLLSMLLAGLTIEVKSPSEAARLETLVALERLAGKPFLPPVLLQSLAARHPVGFGPLREAWIRLRQSGVHPGTVDEATDLVEQFTAGRDALDRLVARVSAHFGVTLEEIFSAKRTRHVSYARQVAAFVAVERGFSLAAVGERLGGRTRSTISYMKHRIQKSRRLDPELDRLLEDFS